MAGSYTLTTNAPAYREAILKWMGRFAVGARAALREQGKLLGLRLIQFTPPRSLKQGQKRVVKDMRRIFYGVKDMGLFSVIEQGKRDGIIETVGGEAAVRIFAKKDGTVYGVDRKLYRPDATPSEMSAFHQRRRDKRGRVGMAGQYTRDIGRWKFLDVMAVPADALHEYMASVIARVGRARGGWASGTIELGGEVPSWIAIHARTAGTFKNEIESSEPSFTFVNKSEWASGDDTSRVLNNAIKTRVRDILRAVKEGGFKKAGAPLT